MKCIMVEHNDGYFNISGASTEEDWEEVQAIAEKVEDRGPLLGWKPYTRVYKVYIRQWTELVELWYFVEANII